MNKKVTAPKRKTAQVGTSKKTKKKSASKLRLPVISSPDTLPLLDPNFTWEKFERFSKQLIKEIYSDHDVKLFGVKGQKQYGVDLIVQDKDGNHFFIQCKMYKTYSIAQFQKTKSELDLKSNKTILFLACEASAKLRLEVLNDPQWDIWDVSDISDKVFQLKNAIRYKLVKRFFGIEWAKAVCEYNEFSSIVSPIDFFRNFFDSKKLFNHTVPLLGRDEELSDLKGFVEGSHQALVLSAAGGVGKSRLLWELSRNCTKSGWSVLFIKEGMPPLADHFQSINAQKVIFVFDDAHRFNLTPYLSFIYALNNIKFKIIFSTRPQGRERLKLDLTKHNLESSEIQDFKIKRFTRTSAKNIASQLLPRVKPQHIWPIANLLADSALVGILACNLIKRKSVSLASLSNETDIKERILSSFTDEISGKIDSKLSNDLIQKILSYISALAPIVYDEKKIDPNFIFATKEKESDINECIADLLHSGILVERGGRLRISPDVLSDCILERSCYLKNDTPSDFFENLLSCVDDELRNNLLKNISELDWRKKKAELTSSVLLRSFWNKFKETSSSDDLPSLNNKLKTVESIAYFQPIESYEVLLGLIKTVLQIPASNRNYSIKFVVNICRNIILAGYNVEDLMVNLWQLGKTDKRDIYSHPEHPLRLLSDLCSYKQKLPIALYEKTLEGLKAIINVYKSKNDHHNPISMLGGFLAKTSISTYSEGYTISISPFHISYENTKKIRTEVFELLEKLALSDDLKTAFLAVEEIAKATTAPQGMMGFKISQKHSSSWHKEIRSAIDLLIKIYEKTSLGLIKVHVKNKLNHKIRRVKRSKYKPLTKFFKSNPFTIDELKYAPFKFCYYKDILIQKDSKEYKKIQEEKEQIYKKVTKNIVIKLKTPKKILKYTEAVVSELLTVSDSVDSQCFSSVLSELIDNKKMCEAILENNSDKLEHSFSVFLKKVSDQNTVTAIQYVEKSLKLKNQAVLESIAYSFWRVFKGQVTNEKVDELFEKLFRHKIEDIRLSSLHGVRELVNKGHKMKAIEHLMTFDLDSKRSAAALFDLINPYCVRFDELTENQLSDLLTKIKNIEDLSDHGVGKFISECANKIPNELFEVLLYRVESKKNHDEQFIAIPYSGFEELSLNLLDDEMLKIFSRVTVALQKNNADMFWLPNLFYELAKNKNDLAVNYLTEIMKSDNIEVVGIAGSLIRKFNDSLVFTQQDWVRDLLSHGKAKGSQFFDEIKSNLFQLGTTFISKGGVAGQPMPEDVALVKNAVAAIAKATSVYEKQFYTELKEYGEKDIAKTMKRNQRFLDEQ